MADLEPRWGNRFAFADRTASRSIEPSSFLERKPALFTRCRFDGEAFRMGRLGNMLKMIEGFLFFNPKQF
jgi:hypothetical protein